MSYELRESGKPPKYNVLLNEPPNGNNPLKRKRIVWQILMKLFNILDEIFPSFNLARISLCKICTCKRAYWSSSIISGNWIVEIKWSRRTLEREEQVLFSKKISFL